jgi:hypothetical protein
LAASPYPNATWQGEAPAGPASTQRTKTDLRPKLKNDEEYTCNNAEVSQNPHRQPMLVAGKQSNGKIRLESHCIFTKSPRLFNKALRICSLINKWSK